MSELEQCCRGCYGTSTDLKREGNIVETVVLSEAAHDIGQRARRKVEPRSLQQRPTTAEADVLQRSSIGISGVDEHHHSLKENAVDMLFAHQSIK